MIRPLALTAAALAAAVGYVVPRGSSPPSSEPPTSAPVGEASVEQEGGTEFERKLAELAFTLYLGSELDIEPGSTSCTEPATLAVGELVTCFTLIGGERVIVAESELSGTPGVYEFVLVSDHQITASDTAPPTTLTTTTAPRATTSLPTPVLITTTVPLSEADRQLLAYGEQINADADEFVDTLVGGDESFISSAEYSWDAATTTVALAVTLSSSFERSDDTMAWILSQDRAMELWSRDSPFRAAQATLQPRLVVTVDGVEFVSDFDLCVRLADQTIAMDEWVAESRQA